MTSKAEDLAKYIYGELSRFSTTKRIKGDGCGVAFLKIDDVDIGEVIKQVKNLVIGRLPIEAELINVEVEKGVFIDMDRETVKIRAGHIFEIYFYDDLSHIYIRIYSLHYLRRRWVAVYIDWSSSSKWW